MKLKYILWRSIDGSFIEHSTEMDRGQFLGSQEGAVYSTFRTFDNASKLAELREHRGQISK